MPDDTDTAPGALTMRDRYAIALICGTNILSLVKGRMTDETDEAAFREWIRLAYIGADVALEVRLEE